MLNRRRFQAIMAKGLAKAERKKAGRPAHDFIFIRTIKLSKKTEHKT